MKIFKNFKTKKQIIEELRQEIGMLREAERDELRNINNGLLKQLNDAEPAILRMEVQKPVILKEVIEVPFEAKDEFDSMEDMQDYIKGLLIDRMKNEISKHVEFICESNLPHLTYICAARLTVGGRR